MTSTETDMLALMYAAFNARDIDAVLASMHPQVDWPNGWEGGRLSGHAAVRDYWTRQWAEVEPTVIPRSFRNESDGRVAVDVHQHVEDKSGRTLADQTVEHIYAFEQGLVRSMEIR